MAVGTPEHAPNLPHIPLPDIRGATRWALTHWKSVGLSLATIAGAGYFAFNHDRGVQSAPIIDNAPFSDTVKPPVESSIDVPGIVITPPVDIAPSIPKPPEVNFVDEAIKSGKIELTQPQEWEKYFELVTANQARTMLEQEKAKGNQNIFLFPQFDLAGVTKDFKVEERTRIIPKSSKPFDELLVTGLNLGTKFYSNHDGQDRPGAAGTTPPVTEISGTSNDGVTFILVLPRIEGKNGITLGEFRTSNNPAFPVQIGTPLDELNTTNTIPNDYGVPGNPQAWFFSRTQNPDGTFNYIGAKLGNALTTPSGKFAMVSSSAG